MATITSNSLSGQHWQAWHDTVKTQLTPSVGAQLAETYAQAAANQGRQMYDDSISKGMGEQQAAAIGLGWVNTYVDQHVPAQPSAPPDPNGSDDTTEVTTDDVKNAVDQYRSGVTNANATYQEISNYKPSPTANQTFTPVTAGQLGASQAKASSYVAAQAKAQGYTADQSAAPDQVQGSTVSLADRLQAARQDRTTVASTNLDTSQNDQSRALQLGGVSALQDTAAGGGTGGALAAARLKAAITKSGQQANGIINGATGSDRHALRLQQLRTAGDQNLAAASSENQNDLANQLTAQGQVVGAGTAVRGQDVDVAAKQADLAQQVKLAQSTLDAAKASGDQSAINAANQKMADLDQQTKEFNASNVTDVSKTNVQNKTQNQQFNAGQTNAAKAQTSQLQTSTNVSNAASTSAASKDSADNATSTSVSNAAQANDVGAKNLDRKVQVGESNNTQGLAAQGQTETQRVANENLKMAAQQAITQNAQGELNEAQREAGLKQAQEQMALAEAAFKAARDDAARAQANEDRSFWSKAASSFLTAGTTVAAAAITASDRNVKENIRKVSPKDLEALTKAVSKSLATYRYKKGKGLQEGEQAGVMVQDLEKTRLGKAVVGHTSDGTKGVNYGQLATLLAAATIKSRKSRKTA